MTPARLVWVGSLLVALLPSVAGASSSGEFSIELTLYNSHEEIVVRDDAGRIISREVHTAEHEEEHGAEPAEPGHAPDPAAPDPKCTNPSTYNYLFSSGGTRVPRPWRTVEPIAFSTNQVPSGVSSYWRTAIGNSAKQWELTTNPCGTPDSIAWRHTTIADTTFALSGTCSNNNDGINMVGFTDLGGWGPNGIILGRACVRATTSWYTEGDIVFNRHADAVWCNGACANGWDLWSVAAHEWGHYLGLGHVCNDADLNNPCDTTAESSAVMYPWISQNSTQNRTLSAGDIAGAQSLYPVSHSYDIVSATLTNPLPGEKLVPGQTYAVTVDLLNTGYETWNLGADTTLTTEPAGRCSQFAGPDWTGCTVASSLDLDVTNEAQGFWPNSSSVVIRGETGRFSLTMTAAPGAAGSTFNEAFRPAAGATRMSGTAVSLPVSVGTLGSEVAQATGPDIKVGTIVLAEDAIIRPVSSSVVIDMRNTGTAPWPLSAPITLRPAACSPFANSGWTSCSVVGALDANLTSPSKSYIGPGETGRVSFLMSGGSVQAGEHQETFGLWRDSVAFGQTATLRFTVA